MVSSQELFSRAVWKGFIPAQRRINMGYCLSISLERPASKADPWLVYGSLDSGRDCAILRTDKGGLLCLSCTKDNCTSAFLLGAWNLGP